jgi:hypothetical protein
LKAISVVTFTADSTGDMNIPSTRSNPSNVNITNATHANNNFAPLVRFTDIKAVIVNIKENPSIHTLKNISKLSIGTPYDRMLLHNIKPTMYFVKLKIEKKVEE